MLEIGVCTNRTNFGKYIEDLLKGILFEYSDWSIEMMPVEMLLEQGREKFSHYHILLLDEQLLKEWGMENLIYLSRLNPDISIILLEGVEGQGITGMRYHLFAYQMKQMRQQELEAELNKKWRHANGADHCLSVRVDGESLLVPIEQIMYIEKRGHWIILHTVLEDYEYYENMYVLEELLKEDGFIRCHQSYMVSKQFVTDYRGMEIWMDQITIPVGRKYKELVGRELTPRAVNRENGKISEKQGVLVGVKGKYKDVTLHFRPEQRILIGRDAKVADIVVNLPEVSRLHCVLLFHEKENTYEIVDVSKNGTYISDGKRLVSDTAYCVKAGTQISFGSLDNVYCLE